MKLMGTSRRRLQQRRRKLMPEPRRAGTPAEQVQDSEITGESLVDNVSASSIAPDLDQIDPPGEDRALVQH